MMDSMFRIILNFLIVFGFGVNIAYLSPVFASTRHHKSHHKQVLMANDPIDSVNINKADAKTIASLKGIGPKRAAAIVAYRDQHGRFNSVNDLVKVKGISQHSLDRLLKKNNGRIVI